MLQKMGRRLSGFVLVLLAIELLDELVFGAREAAWPLIRDDLGLSYVQIGLLLGIPTLVSSFIEPALGVLGDVWKRRLIILGGGVAFTVALLLTGVSHSFILLLLAFMLYYPASGAFVSLSQAALMDHNPARHEQNMARWTLAGSIGVVLGPLALGAVVAAGLGWRGTFLLLAGLSFILMLAASRFPFVNGHRDGKSSTGFITGVKAAFRALRRPEVLRWLTLLQFSDLMLDVLLGYLALYFVDVVGTSEAQAGFAVAVWTGVGLVGDLLLLPLLERIRGLTYLRYSAAIELVLFVAFLLVGSLPLKLALLGLLGAFNAGWYSILQAQVYTAMPGQSGTVIAIYNLFALIGGLIPLAIGLLAEHFGLNTAMWFLLLGPIALLVGLPFRRIPATGSPVN